MIFLSLYFLKQNKKIFLSQKQIRHKYIGNLILSLSFFFFLLFHINGGYFDFLMLNY
jgi:hypothetical protein